MKIENLDLKGIAKANEEPGTTVKLVPSISSEAGLMRI
jgi:hypothetical protein